MHHFKFTTRPTFAALIGMMLSFVASMSHADTVLMEEPHAADASHWGLGIGLGSESRPYRGVSNHVSVLPLVLYENRWIHFFGNTFDVKLGAVDQFSFTLRAKYDSNDGYKGSDSDALRGMDERRRGRRHLG